MSHADPTTRTAPRGVGAEGDRSLRPLTDADDLGDFEVDATGADTPVGFRIVVDIPPEHLKGFVAAAHAEGLDVVAYVQRRIRELGKSLRGLEPPPVPPPTPEEVVRALRGGRD